MAYYMNNILFAAVCLKIKLLWNLSVQLDLSDVDPKTENRDTYMSSMMFFVLLIQKMIHA